MPAGVVRGAEAGLPGRGHETVILAGDMVGDEIDDDLQAGGMGPLHQGLELGHAPGGIVRQIGIDVIVIRYGIGRSGLALDDLGGNAPAVGLLRGMADDAGIPHGAGPHLVAEIGEKRCVDGGELSVSP